MADVNCLSFTAISFTSFFTKCGNMATCSILSSRSSSDIFFHPSSIHKNLGQSLELVVLKIFLFLVIFVLNWSIMEELADILDDIEHLPEEVRRMLTEMQELDSSAEKGIRKVQQLSEDFFGQCSLGILSGSSADAKCDDIVEEYRNVASTSEKKMNLCNDMESVLRSVLGAIDAKVSEAETRLEKNSPGSVEKMKSRLEQEWSCATTSAAASRNN